jgi:membrane-associated phospholipid phosphatase
VSSSPAGSITALNVALTAALGLTLTYVVAVRTPVGQLLDTRWMLITADALAPRAWPNALLNVISPTTFVMAAGSLAAIAGARRGLRGAVLVLVTTGATAASAVVLKALLVRPQLFDAAANSMPSGHVAAVAGFAAAATAVTSRAYRSLVVTGGLAAVGLTGLATIAAQWHRPSDVLAAGLLAIAVTASASAVARCPRPRGGPMLSARRVRHPEAPSRGHPGVIDS